MKQNEGALSEKAHAERPQAPPGWRIRGGRSPHARCPAPLPSLQVPEVLQGLGASPGAPGGGKARRDEAHSTRTSPIARGQLRQQQEKTTRAKGAQRAPSAGPGKLFFTPRFSQKVLCNADVPFG